MFENVTVILPSLNPDFRLNLVVDGCIEQGFTDIILVNDGSGEEFLEPFVEASRKPGVTVLTHEVNKGKGCALKTAIKYIVENRPNSKGIVTADGDNQHHKEDIAACTRAMLESGESVFGCRNFSGDDIPWKSKCGNNITRFVFRVFCGVKISDTQTGLRAFPSSYYQALLETEGERYEYETNVILELNSRNLKFNEVRIRTIYEDMENSTTHFHPIRDSFKIYKVIFKYMFSAGASSLIDVLGFMLASTILSKFIDHGFTAFGHVFARDWLITYGATVLARLVSSVFNYKVNKHIVFKSHAKGTLVKYYALVLFNIVLSGACVSMLSVVASAGNILRTVFKIIVDSFIFLLSFRIQRAWVYREKK